MKLGPMAALALAAVLSAAGSSSAEAREKEECQTAWAQAVRSYLTQNRTKGPADEEFAAACALEKDDKPKARVEAVVIGARALAKLDMVGCERFLDVYVGSSEPKKICSAAGGGDEAELRKLISSTLPPPKTKK